MCPEKLWGRSSRPLRCLLEHVLNASCWSSSLLSFWLPWIYSPFSIFHGLCNGDLLQLIECIESTQNEVKRKMIESSACNAEPKSPEETVQEKFARANRELSIGTSSLCRDLHFLPDDLRRCAARRCWTDARRFLAAARTSAVHFAIYNQGRFRTPVA
jgi:hypothetical protein